LPLATGSPDSTAQPTRQPQARCTLLRPPNDRHGRSPAIGALTAPGGRLHETRAALVDACAASPHLDLVAPQGALYGFPAVIGDAARGFDDHAFALELMEEEGVLVVPGSSFNVPYRNHFRVTLLPEAPVLREVFARIDRVLSRRAATATAAAATAAA
jgi:alanine-synthesizing transaminase